MVFPAYHIPPSLSIFLLNASRPSFPSPFITFRSEPTRTATRPKIIPNRTERAVSGAGAMHFPLVLSFHKGPVPVLFFCFLLQPSYALSLCHKHWMSSIRSHRKGSVLVVCGFCFLFLRFRSPYSSCSSSSSSSGILITPCAEPACPMGRVQ